MAELAVFTGDIVKSGALEDGALDAIFEALEAAAATLSDWQGMPARLTRFRGDGWQMVVAPHLALRAAVLMRAAVRRTGKGRDTRIAIGFGSGTVAGDDLSDASGPAFEAAGAALDALTRGARMVAPGGSQALRTALPLADHIARNWTARQAEVVAALLSPDRPSQETVAHALGITQQTVQDHADSGAAQALADGCAAIEDRR